MPFTLDNYSETRPFLYHLTAQENIDRIKSSGCLESAAVLLNSAENKEIIRTRRIEKMPVRIDSEQIVLRDQAPLYADNINFTDGWTLGDFVEDLNRRVFFWSGWQHAPISYGENHFARYSEERPVVIRTRFNSLLVKNPGRRPLFCKYNSGAPRQFQGRQSPRGPGTFLPAEQCPYTCGKVVEVTFIEAVKLPEDTEISFNARGPWKPMFSRT
ncbi:MAG TPA: hypothetical protein VFJ72_07220 [Rubrobacteraceae bacterium]|nr:hypothetical protein [Rubrobacteraceae bacterium]